MPKLEGNWTKGWAFDLHTISSRPTGYSQSGRLIFDTTRPEMGELINRLKYRGEREVIGEIISLLAPIKNIDTFDVIIPVPSSKGRNFQPAAAIAEALGKQRGVRVLKDYLSKSGKDEIKNIENPENRPEMVKKQISISGKDDLSGKKVLLLDDVYDTGATLNFCCTILKEQAKVGSVSVLTMTKTRVPK